MISKLSIKLKLKLFREFRIKCISHKGIERLRPSRENMSSGAWSWRIEMENGSYVGSQDTAYQIYKSTNLVMSENSYGSDTEITDES